MHVPRVTRSSGISVVTPDAVRVPTDAPAGARSTRPQRDARSRGRPRGPVPLQVQTGASGATHDVFDLLGDELQLKDVIALQPTVTPTSVGGTRSRGSERVDAQQRVDIDVPLEAGEWAVVLVEQDGVFAWDFGEVDDAPTAPHAPGGATRRGGERSSRRVARFHLDLYARGTPARRRSTQGFARSLLLRPALAAVFTFGAELVVGQVVRRLERDVERGMVHITAPEPETWKRLSSMRTLRQPTERAARILLFVHGTFSSTVGGFGELALTEAGRAFLADAASAYDVVLGFDHATLSEDPVENAEQLLEALRAIPGSHPPNIDVIAHSRGALVIRSLVEHLQPRGRRQTTEGLDAHVRRLVLVGGTNNGTALAQAANWYAMIDLYTNLVVAGSRVLSLAGPKGAAVGRVVRAGLGGLARFAKAVTVVGLDPARVPGLAAMDPTQAFVRELNQTQPGQPTPDDLDVFVITSDFDAAGPVDPSTGMTQRLIKALADRLVDQLMGVENDLVVDVASMTHVDPHVEDGGGFIRGVHDFGTNARVHHTNYFLQPDTFLALRRWLGVGSPQSPTDRGVVRGEPGHVAVDLPTVADADFVEIDAAMSASLARELTSDDPSRFVVVRRREPDGGALYRYAFAHDEFTDMLRSLRSDDDTSLEGLGVLYETQASPEVSPAQSRGYAVADAATPWARRQVVLSEGRPIGVVPHVGEAASPMAALADEPSVTVPQVAARRRSAVAPRQTGTRGVQPPARRGALEATAPPPAESETVQQFFRAQMDDEIMIDRATTLTVEVSADSLTAAARGGAAAGSGDVISSRTISIAVIGRRNVVVVGDDRVDVQPAEPKAPHRLFFEVRGTHEGDGEVWVIAQQGPQPLVTLVLNVTVVAERISGRRRHAVSDAVAPMLAQPQRRNQLRIVEQRHGTEASFDFEFRSEALDRFEFATTRLNNDPATYVAALYREIEEKWIDTDSDVDAFAVDLQAMGATMFERLIPAPIQRALWDGRDTIDSIEVVSTEPFIPWELVHLRDPDARGLDDTERFFGLMGMVRWLHGAGLARPTIKLENAVVKAVVPDYPAGSGKELPATRDELDYLERTLGAERVPAQHADLLRLLRTPGSFDVLHFAGHGVAAADDIANAQLILEGRVEDGVWYPSELSATTVDAFARLEADDGSRPLVFLNACQVGRAGYQLTGLGGFAQAFLKGRAGAFVGSLWAVGDAPAATFSQAFYGALKSGKTLSEATTAARRAARAAGEASWLAYAVYGDPHAVAV